MEVEFDADKDAINRFKHRLPLAFGKRVLEADGSITLPTFRIGDEEERFKAIGLVEGKLYTAVHVWRGDVVRMISVRRSNDTERRNYDRDTRRPQ
ncbi:MAG: BrnT family toxin [Sphingomonadaceae bacterium]